MIDGMSAALLLFIVGIIIVKLVFIWTPFVEQKVIIKETPNLKDKTYNKTFIIRKVPTLGAIPLFVVCFLFIYASVPDALSNKTTSTYLLGISLVTILGMLTGLKLVNKQLSLVLKYINSALLYVFAYLFLIVQGVFVVSELGNFIFAFVVFTLVTKGLLSKAK